MFANNQFNLLIYTLKNAGLPNFGSNMDVVKKCNLKILTQRLGLSIFDPNMG